MSSEERKSRLVVLVLVFPEELAAVDDLAVAQVENVQRDQRRFGVDREDIDVVAFGGGHFLALLDLLHGGDQVAQSGGFFEAHFLAGGFHARAQSAGQIAVAAIEEEADVAHGGGVGFVGGQAPARTVPGSGECGTAGRAWDGSA